MLNFMPIAGANGGARVAHLCHAACQACPTSGGADPGRSVRQRHLAVRQRLLRSAQTPEDHRGGAGHHRHHRRVREHGAGK